MIKQVIVAVAISMSTASASAAGDAERGKQKADQVCAACHAVGGDWTKPLQPEYPRLGGQHKDYLTTALNAYKQGDRSVIGRKNAIMAGQAAALSKQEIEDIAAYLSGLSGPMHVKR
jgi:cytochrome c553